MTWPATRDEDSRHYMTAQLLAWPAQGDSSLSGFSDSVLSVVECVDALQNRLLQDVGSYPEDHALFVDMELSHDIKLAATFVASVQDTLWESNEATSHIAEQLYRLASSGRG